MNQPKQPLGDPWVLEVQQWLNKTYGKNPNFGNVVENGRTGWDTIYGIIRAIQLELQVTTTPVNNFGPGTVAAWDQQVAPHLTVGYNKGHIVELIDAGFRCKGMGAGKFSPTYTQENIDALLELKADAGFSTADTGFSSEWAKALFDMSAFVLVLNGDSTIREMQQYLNYHYSAYTGILPCDGIYQRQTNTALIYALQAEIGMDPSTANGNYGPGTSAGTPTLTVGATGNFVKILQFGLYVNGFNQTGDFSAIFSEGIGEQIVAFRQFMVLPPFIPTSDLTVMKGLLTSNGNTDRAAAAFDTSTILTQTTAQALKNQGYTIVGRYLTGTVGTGPTKRDKSLSPEEITAITSAGLAIFPIYQDGGASEDYFTAEQGAKDAQLAMEAAYDLGFPLGTTLYFACDVDIQEGDIPGTVLPYFEAISTAMVQDQTYTIGIYGTRNVCQQVIHAGFASQAFVSNMSSGYSGNLGFPMPKAWAFDQFVETEAAGVGIDKVAVSGKDQGTNTFATSQEAIAKRELLKFYKNFGVKEIEFEWEKTIGVEPALNYVVYLTPHMDWKISGKDYGISLLVTDKKVDLRPYMDDITHSLLDYSTYLRGTTRDFDTLINKFGPKVENGGIALKVSTRNGLLGTKLLLTFDRKIQQGAHEIESKFQLEVEIYNKPFIDSPLPDPVYQDIVKKIEEGTFVTTGEFISGVMVSAFAAGALFIFGGEILGTIGLVIVGITEAVTTVAEALTAIGITLMGIYEEYVK